MICLFLFTEAYSFYEERRQKKTSPLKENPRITKLLDFSKFYCIFIIKFSFLILPAMYLTQNLNKYKVCIVMGVVIYL